MGKTINESLTKKQIPVMTIVVATLLLISAGAILLLRVVSDHKISVDSWENYAAESYGGGDGSINDPFVIASAEELALLAKETNQGGNTKDVYYILTKDINLGAHAWMPIGKQSAFEGILNGAGFTISNLLIEAKEEVSNYGLFGWMKGTVCNLNITDAKVSVLFMTNRKNWQPDGGVNIGILCGILEGDVSTVGIKGTIDTQETENIIVGMLAAKADSSSVDSVEIRGDITVYNDNCVVAGGVCGQALGAVCFDRVAYKGKINYSDNSLNPSVIISGFIADGMNWESVYMKNCQAVSTIKLPKNAAYSAAGLVGKTSSFSDDDFVFCSFAKCYIDGEKKVYLPCFEDGVITSDVKVVKSVAEENLLFEDNGLYASGYFASNKKFSPYGGSGKELTAANYKKYFKKTLGYNFTSAWTKGAANYPVSKYDSKSYNVGASKEAYNIVFYSASKAYFYEYGRMDYEYTGLHEQDGDIWYIKNGKVDFDADGPVSIDGTEYTVKGGKVIR